MATVRVNFGTAMGAGVPSYPPTVKAGQTFTSSGSNQTTTASADSGDFAHVTSSGGAVSVNIGATPNASSDPTWIVVDGETKLFGPLQDGDKVAIVDA